MGRRQFDDYEQDEWQEHHAREERHKQRREAHLRKRAQDAPAAPKPDRHSHRDHDA
ncbi:hypothetical protein K8B33_04265 [Alcanivorax sp. JB21]|uniref:hypothetical protein n=1 Tax=Alcanivorax limicola TaxID=2874102 RepID=UPI001CBD38CA|nr:hypothetical protein [Alcanivorax limicola]MBZ2188295.1 hypothetical protein [Alcanivorax limicola]